MDIKQLSGDDLLRAVGLQTRKTAINYVLPVLGVFGAGLLAGAGLGMLLAPRSGRELRSDVRGMARRATHHEADVNGPDREYRANEPRGRREWVATPPRREEPPQMAG